MTKNKNILLLKDIENAAQQLENTIIKTPLQYAERLSQLYEANIYIKREDLQRCRSFKVRGAYNKIVSLAKNISDNYSRNIVCASAGNHAQGVAYSCARLQLNGAIFMPISTPLQKIDQVKQFGGQYIEIITTGNTFDDASIASHKYCEENNSIYIHPFNDYEVMCGQATVGMEIYSNLGDTIDCVIIPIGGGGLAAGISSYLKQFKPSIDIIGVEPSGAGSMNYSIKKGYAAPLDSIDNFVDGAAVKHVGDATFAICKDYLSTTVLVPEGKVCTTMIELYQYDGIIAEPAGALSISALDSLDIKGKNVVCILSGGNNDITRYPEIIERSLVYNGKKHYFILELNQKPGQLRRFLNDILGPTDDIVRFEYLKKTNREKAAALVGIELYSKDDYLPLIERMRASGIHFTLLSNKDLFYNYII